MPGTPLCDNRMCLPSLTMLHPVTLVPHCLITLPYLLAVPLLLTMPVSVTVLPSLAVLVNVHHSVTVSRHNSLCRYDLLQEFPRLIDWSCKTGLSFLLIVMPHDMSIYRTASIV